MRRCEPLVLTKEVRRILTALSRSYTCASFLNERSKVVILASEGKSNKEIGKQLQMHWNTVGK